MSQESRNMLQECALTRSERYGVATDEQLDAGLIVPVCIFGATIIAALATFL